MSRIAVRTALTARTCIAARSAPAVLGRAVITPSAQAGRFAPVSLQARWKTTAAPNKWAKNPLVSYEELRPITEQPSDDILLIDVREPDEVALGSIPSAVSLPLSELRGALDKNYSPGEFQKKFAFSKPLPEQNIIFFCRSGKRSATAAEWAGEQGYGNVRNYIGSWLDWTKREKERDNNDD